MARAGVRRKLLSARFIGPVHIEALARIGVRVTAVCDSTRNAQAVAERFCIARAIGD